MIEKYKLFCWCNRPAEWALDFLNCGGQGCRGLTLIPDSRISWHGDSRNETKPHLVNQGSFLGYQIELADSSQREPALTRGDQAAHLPEGAAGFY